jgi:hypothetical protein
MKFSVVTISFNQRQYLEEALRSVLTQDYPAIEQRVSARYGKHFRISELGRRAAAGSAE